MFLTGLRQGRARTGERRTMYETHFGLRRRPFPATPDGDCYYPASTHEQALARLTQALQDGEGLVLLTGVPGTGKTLLGQRLLEQSTSEAECAFLTHAHFSTRAGLLQAVLYDLGLPYEGRTEQELRLALTDHLLKHYAEGRRSLLFVDEAQLLAPALLEELRLLGNLEGRQGKALQVVLLGQEAVAQTLHRPELAAFRQRLGAHARLEPFDLHEAVDYLVHHLRQAGGCPEAILTDEALEVLARGGRGIPRLLNRAAHGALRLAYQAGTETVDAEVALESLTVLGLAEDGAAEEVPATAEDGAASSAVLALDVPRETERERDRRLFAAPKRPA